MLGVSIDITERRRVEKESREVSGKLITAQEDERKRIARDLHDDLNQRLALLSVEMEIFGAESKDTRDSAREHLESMTSQVKETLRPRCIGSRINFIPRSWISLDW